MSQPKIFVIERNGKPIGLIHTGDKPEVGFTEDAFSDLYDRPTDQATATETSS